MISELEEEVKDKEKEIKRLGDGWSDSEEKLTGLRNMMSWKVKEIGDLKQRVNKLEVEKLPEEVNDRHVQAFQDSVRGSLRAKCKRKQQELDQVRIHLRQTRERLQLEEGGRKEREEEAKALRAELSTVAERAKKEEPENVEMGGFGPLSQKNHGRCRNEYGKEDICTSSRAGSGGGKAEGYTSSFRGEQ